MRRAWRRWLLKRHPRSACWVVEQRCLYIVPTSAGLVFGGTLALMLLAAINLQLTLGYLLCFALAGTAFASMLQTHRGLRGLQFQLREAAPGFAGQPLALQVECLNPGPARHGLVLAWEGARARPAGLEVTAQGQALVELRWTPPARGRHALPALRVQSCYPFGLFRAWTLWRPAAPVLAWPAPERPAPPLPSAQHPGAAAPARVTPQDGDFAGVRAYRRGDAPRELLWKKSAHHGEPVSRERQAGQPAPLWLRWQDTAGDTEARLSRLAAWVLAAGRGGRPCGLELPGLRIEAGQGAAHRARLLQALALWSDGRARGPAPATATAPD